MESEAPKRDEYGGPDVKLKRGDTSEFSRGHGSDREVVHYDDDYTINLLYGFFVITDGDVD